MTLVREGKPRNVRVGVLQLAIKYAAVERTNQKKSLQTLKFKQEDSLKNSLYPVQKKGKAMACSRTLSTACLLLCAAMISVVLGHGDYIRANICDKLHVSHQPNQNSFNSTVTLLKDGVPQQCYEPSTSYTSKSISMHAGNIYCMVLQCFCTIALLPLVLLCAYYI